MDPALTTLHRLLEEHADEIIEAADILGGMVAEAIAWTSSGSKVKAASPAISGRLELLLHATAAPHAIASSTGRPKPSYWLGSTKTLAAA